MASNDATTVANRSAMTPERLVVIFTLCLAIVLVLFLKHVLAPVWVAVGLPDRPLIEGAEEWTYSSLVAGILLFFIDTVSYKLMVEWLPALWGKL